MHTNIGAHDSSEAVDRSNPLAHLLTFSAQCAGRDIGLQERARGVTLVIRVCAYELANGHHYKGLGGVRHEG